MPDGVGADARHVRVDGVQGLLFGRQLPGPEDDTEQLAIARGKPRPVKIDAEPAAAAHAFARLASGPFPTKSRNDIEDPWRIGPRRTQDMPRRRRGAPRNVGLVGGDDAVKILAEGGGADGDISAEPIFSVAEIMARQILSRGRVRENELGAPLIERTNARFGICQL